MSERAAHSVHLSPVQEEGTPVPRRLFTPCWLRPTLRARRTRLHAGLQDPGTKTRSLSTQEHLQQQPTSLPSHHHGCPAGRAQAEATWTCCASPEPAAHLWSQPNSALSHPCPGRPDSVGHVCVTFLLQRATQPGHARASAGLWARLCCTAQVHM